MTVLAHDVEGPADAPLVVFLHGILGSRRNLMSMARRVARGFSVRVSVFDHRGHGDSDAKVGPQTVSQCANDIADTVAVIGDEPIVVVGHSFGGKVALLYARDFAASLTDVVVLDAPFGPTDNSAGLKEIETVIARISDVEMPVAGRQELVAALRARGLSQAIARWMTTNVKPVEGGLGWRFDLDVVRALIDDYATIDLHPFVDVANGAPRIHLVRGALSDRFSDRELARVDAHRQAGRLSVDVVEGTGHWLHTERPDAVYAHIARVVARATGVAAS